MAKNAHLLTDERTRKVRNVRLTAVITVRGMIAALTIAVRIVTTVTITVRTTGTDNLTIRNSRIAAALIIRISMTITVCAARLRVGTMKRRRKKIIVLTATITTGNARSNGIITGRAIIMTANPRGMIARDTDGIITVLINSGMIGITGGATALTSNGMTGITGEVTAHTNSAKIGIAGEITVRTNGGMTGITIGEVTAIVVNSVRTAVSHSPKDRTIRLKRRKAAMTANTSQKSIRLMPRQISLSRSV